MTALRTRLSRPMTWMVVIEVLLVAGLLVAAWRVWDDRQHPAQAAGAAMAAGLPTPSSLSSPSPSPGAGQTPLGPPPAPPSAGPTPGLRTDPDFVQEQMRRLGSDQAAMERFQWQLVDTVTKWAARYIDTVVVPSVESANAS